MAELVAALGAGFSLRRGVLIKIFPSSDPAGGAAPPQPEFPDQTEKAAAIVSFPSLDYQQLRCRSCVASCLCYQHYIICCLYCNSIQEP